MFIVTGAIIILLTVLCRPVENFENVAVTLRNAETQVYTRHSISYSFNMNSFVKSADLLLAQGQYLPQLTRNVFGNLPRLKNLSLPSNGIRRIESGTFKYLTNLMELNLAHNRLKEIPGGVFNGLPSVQSLHLQNNSVSRIALDAFDTLALATLNLTNNRITGWNPEWFRKTSVVVLDLSNNLIDTLPQRAFSKLEEPRNHQATSIYLSYNRIRRLNNELFYGFRTFDRIYFDCNQIEDVQVEAFHSVRTVNVLNLNNNSISHIGASVFSDVKVNVLMAEDNQLRCISTDIFWMLEELDIDGNPISCGCVKSWMGWRENYSHPAIYHITNLEEECI